MNANAPLAGDNPAARFRALLSRVPTGRTSPPRNASPPSLHSPATPSDLLESDLETPDISTIPQHSASSLSIARESLRSIFMRARRDPGGTPQKNKTPRATRRSSFDTSDADVASRTIRSKWKGKRKSLSDEEDIQSSSFLFPSLSVSVL
ncbi:hypothetical protein AMATHDRAFT_141102 [Amanita thiersii Skay4041]|uniref:Uncharacterized protein n=1 Tax=Amanita thiersii Skay4041 TaxID=703135 RepID=A0A2A9NWD5_9AGAR|nr:hypothetical protein AMATHDRAFT_141102 [Amanita thiersii Skay4041]